METCSGNDIAEKLAHCVLSSSPLLSLKPQVMVNKIESIIRPTPYFIFIVLLAH